ncbi:hypothetical protein NEOC65_001604 [Neochlamydia sp. AcF65]|nr:hypothetical protein [Neochlamydia sp. AcF65]MBS4169900.1 hypothetical protein [Neochlamydia sp. AcF95]
MRRGHSDLRDEGETPPAKGGDAHYSLPSCMLFSNI